MHIPASFDILTHWPLDWTILGIFILLVFAENMRAGTNKATSLALALPVAYLLFQLIQNAALVSGVVGQFKEPIAQAALFGALTVLAFIFVHRTIGFFGGSYAGFLNAGIGAAALAIAVIVFWMFIPALDTLWHFGPQLQAVFGAAYRFWWLLAAYFALALVRS